MTDSASGALDIAAGRRIANVMDPDDNRHSPADEPQVLTAAEIRSRTNEATNRDGVPRTYASDLSQDDADGPNTGGQGSD